MEVFFNLEREISMATEALLIEHGIPCARRFTHEELQPTLAAIRAIEAAKLKGPTGAQIDAAMFDAINGPKTEPEGAA